MLNISIIGLGLMGKQHLKAIQEHPDCAVASIIDNSSDAKDIAFQQGHPYFKSLEEAITVARPDGLIVATPNSRHFQDGILALEAGIPILIEKPISDSLDDAAKLIELGRKKNIPILTGYHRRTQVI